MADNKIDYREMYSNRRRKSRAPETVRTPKPKKEPDHGFFKPTCEKTSETPGSYARLSAREMKDAIRERVLDNPDLRPHELAEEMKRRHGTSPSVVLISNIRTEFKATLRFLKARGMLKNVTREKREMGRRNDD